MCWLLPFFWTSEGKSGPCPCLNGQVAHDLKMLPARPLKIAALKRSPPSPGPTLTVLPPSPPTSKLPPRFCRPALRAPTPGALTELSGSIYIYQHWLPRGPRPWQPLYPHLGIKPVSSLPAYLLQLALRPGEEPAVGRTKCKLVK